MPSPVRPRLARPTADAFRLAQERYSSVGVRVEQALDILGGISISMHCWQGDDVRGFESLGRGLDGGLAVTGSHPGRARTPDELRLDLEKALALVPGRHRVNLHACYGEFGKRVPDRDALGVEHFRNWISWARGRGLALDFNPTCFSHPKAADGFTLSHADRSIRRFWIEHCRRAREIGAAMGRTLGSPCVTNVWVPDGFKDTPADRVAPRQRLAESLDAVFERPFPRRHLLDSVEPKLFGIGAESCTVGSAEFYLGYAITRGTLLCLDSGHFHPTESTGDKISAVLQYLKGILLHVSRGVRWDSDHVVTLTDDLLSIARESVACGDLSRVHFGLDYFDASINRIAAWVTGTRALQRAILAALLEPPGIRVAELAGDRTARLVLQEEAKGLPAGAVWDSFCERQGVPVGERWLAEVRRYEQGVLKERC